METSSIVKINPSEYGLTETKAKEIEKMFSPMLAKMVELEAEFNEISKLEPNKESCSKARELRLKYVKVRTGTAEIHKGLKQFYLQGGRFVDGWKNAQLMASQGIEEKLSTIENHYENLEKERIARLQEKRAEEISKYEVDYIPDNLGEMPEDVWNNFLLGTRTNYEAQKEAEKKAEEERQEQIRLDKRESGRRERILPYSDYWGGIIDAGGLRDLSDEVFEAAFEEIVAAKKEDDKKQEQIRKDNLRLQKEAEDRERKRIAEEKKRKIQEEKDRKIREEKEQKEREAHEAELKKAQDEKDRIEKELNDKRIAEEKIKTDRLASIEAEKNKGDTDKVNDLVNDLESIKTKYQFESAKNQKMYSDVGLLIDKLINHINSAKSD